MDDETRARLTAIEEKIARWETMVTEFMNGPGKAAARMLGVKVPEDLSR